MQDPTTPDTPGTHDSTDTSSTDQGSERSMSRRLMFKLAGLGVATGATAVALSGTATTAAEAATHSKPECVADLMEGN